MICPDCGFENPPRFKFCGECGAAIGTAAVRPQAPERKPRDYTPRHLRAAQSLWLELGAPSRAQQIARELEAK